MKRIWALITAFILLPAHCTAVFGEDPLEKTISANAACSAGGFDSCDMSGAEDPILPSEYQAHLGKGMDVDWCKTSAGMSYYNSKIPSEFKKAGISHVRIRVKDDATDELLDLLTKQVNDCLNSDLIPIIAYQADKLKNDPSDENLVEVENWWKTVASHFSETSHMLSFDLIIEVTDALKNMPDRLNEIYERLVSAVRETNPERIIMISPGMRSDPDNLCELVIPSKAEDYIMAEWHFYASGPAKDNSRKLWTFGTDEEKKLIQDKIDAALRWQEKTGVLTWVGAWMPGNYNDGNDYSVAEQAVFASFMTEALTKAGIPFAINADSHFYDRENGGFIPEMQPVLSAIFGENNPTNSLPFKDVAENSWYYSDILYVYQAKLFSGISENMFGPDMPMTRQQMWTAAARMTGYFPLSEGDARIWALDSGVSDGSDPFSAVTRQQLATFLWRLAGSPEGGEIPKRFKDSDKAAPYALEAVSWVINSEIMNGISDDMFMPEEQALRSQVAAVLRRYLEKTSEL